MTDLETLQESYKKYKDKQGRKAQNLKIRIQCFEAFNKLIKYATSRNR